MAADAMRRAEDAGACSGAPAAGEGRPASPAGAGCRARRYAVIDLGTVTCRMLVADVDADGALNELRREYAIVNLGEGVDASGALSPAAIERVAATVRRYRALADGLAPAGGAVEMVALATSAARDAVNKSELIARLAREGVDLRIIPGEVEARLSFAGASLDYAGEDLAVVDVGGGSTEVVVGRGGAAPARSRSFDVGCRRMTERFFAADPPTADELARAAQWVADEMAPYFDRLREDGLSWRRLVAVAGTATTAVSVHERMERYDASAVHGYRVGKAVLDEELARLAALPLAQRRDVVGLDPDRAPVIVAGFVILSQVLRLAGVDAYTASETDILQGALAAVARGERL